MIIRGKSPRASIPRVAATPMAMAIGVFRAKRISRAMIKISTVTMASSDFRQQNGQAVYHHNGPAQRNDTKDNPFGKIKGG
jgi:hypothetical protein